MIDWSKLNIPDNAIIWKCSCGAEGMWVPAPMGKDICVPPGFESLRGAAVYQRFPTMDDGREKHCSGHGTVFGKAMVKWNTSKYQEGRAD